MTGTPSGARSTRRVLIQSGSQAGRPPGTQGRGPRLAHLVVLSRRGILTTPGAFSPPFSRPRGGPDARWANAKSPPGTKRLFGNTVSRLLTARFSAPECAESTAMTAIMHAVVGAESLARIANAWPALLSHVPAQDSYHSEKKDFCVCRGNQIFLNLALPSKP